MITVIPLDSGTGGSSGGGSSNGGSSSSSSSSGGSSNGGSSSSSSSSGGSSSGAVDSTVADVADTGADMTIADGGSDVEETGADATVDAADAGGADAGHDAGSDAADSGAGLVPCTSTGQTNCVQCIAYSGMGTPTGKPCTETEAVLVQKDIALGNVTAPGMVPTTLSDGGASCYWCADYNSCINDPMRHQAGFDCEDLSPPANFTNGSGASVPTVSTCVATLACAVNSTTGMACALNSQGIDYCYCGSGGGGSSSACTSHGPNVNGPCLAQEVAGFPYAQSDSSHIVGNYTNGMMGPSGQANQILSCIAMNSNPLSTVFCPSSCLQ
jgi:hypothetical protein